MTEAVPAETVMTKDERIALLEREVAAAQNFIESAFQMLEAHCVSRERARSVANGIQVLGIRKDRAITDARVECERLGEQIEKLSLLNVEYAGKIDRLSGALQMIAEGLCPSLVPPMTAEQIARAALDVSVTTTEKS